MSGVTLEMIYNKLNDPLSDGLFDKLYGSSDCSFFGLLYHFVDQDPKSHLGVGEIICDGAQESHDINDIGIGVGANRVH